jgi:hypothetical protein
MTNSPIRRVPIPPATPTLTLATIAVFQAKQMIVLTEMVRRMLASYVAMLWLFTFGWLGVTR